MDPEFSETNGIPVSPSVTINDINKKAHTKHSQLNSSNSAEDDDDDDDEFQDAIDS